MTPTQKDGANDLRECGAKVVRAIAAAVLLAAAPALAVAQNHYPSRLIKIIVPLPGGAGIADTLPRIVADKLAARWGQPVIIENWPGAALNIGAEAVARANPDGYTLLATPPGPLVISQSFYQKLAFDPGAFVPVSIVAAVPLVFVVHPKVPASTLQELIAFAKANPDKLNYASSGTGSLPHLTVEMLLNAAGGVRMVHVPYKGLAPAFTDLIAGRVDMMVDNLGNALPRIKDGKLKALGVGNEARLAELPDVPAIAEIFPGFYSTTWFAVVAPPRTPPEIAGKLSSAIAETLQLPDVARKFSELSATPVGGSAAETGRFIKREAERWRGVIVSAGLKPD